MRIELKTRFLSRLDSLIEEGQKILGSVEKKQVSRVVAKGLFSGEPVARRTETVVQFDGDATVQLFAKARTVLMSVLPEGHPNRICLEIPGPFVANVSGIRFCVAILKATRDDLESGFLDSLSSQIESVVQCDYLNQAELLLQDSSNASHTHIAAAVIAGAVLEQGLRSLCQRQNPPIATLKANGEPMTLNPLIDELKRAGIVNELRAKELRSWADIRNAAAHGEFAKFNSEQVERMLSGITSFLAGAL